MTLHFSFLSFNSHDFSESIIYKKLKDCLYKLTLSSGKVAYQLRGYCPDQLLGIHNRRFNLLFPKLTDTVMTFEPSASSLTRLNCLSLGCTVES